MAYFARVDENMTVVEVISVSNAEAPDPAPSHSEALGKAFIAAPPPRGLGKPGRWIQTSYNGSIRKQYAGIGFTYDPRSDVFVKPRPYPSWTLDQNHDWQPPTPVPDNVNFWTWDEGTLSWVEVAPQ